MVLRHPFENRSDPLCGFDFMILDSLLQDFGQWDDRKQRTSEEKTGSGRKKKREKKEKKKVPRN